MISGYYNRFDPSKNYEAHAFRAGYVLQSAEMNEIQSAHLHRLGMLGDALFKDGDIVRDARIVVNSVTGEVICESGAVYLRGAVRGVPPRTITVPLDRSVAVGVWLIESTITEVEDPALKDPAAETRNYQEPGASRLQVVPQWGHDSDGTQGQFYPVYYVDNGQLRAKEAPPVMDSVTQAIARYDRDSAGSNYIVSGMRVSQLADLSNGTQVYSIQDGRARVNGFGVTLSASRRLEYPAIPDLRFIDSEPHVSSTTALQRVDTARSPIDSIQHVRITAQQTAVVVHGSFAGAQDPLPETAVVDIIEVKQGATTYVKGVDYKLTTGRVDWSLAGAEPAPGSSYDATFQYIASVTPTAADDTGFSVTGAVVGSLIQVTYNCKLPRIDRLCMNEGGEFVWFQGVSTDYDPVRPNVPATVTPLAQIHQTWDANRTLVNDGVRVVPMSDIEAMNARMDLITDLVAQQKLVSDLSTRDQAARKGLFVDPFLDDTHRDQGVAQTAAIVDGILMLPISGAGARPSADVTEITACDYTLSPVLMQEARTGAMKINPYMAFSVMPSQVALDPPVDYWTVVQTDWTSPVTREFTRTTTESLGLALQVIRSTTTTQQLVKTETQNIANLRQIDVKFHITGFGPGEVLQAMKFDGLTVTPSAL